MAGPLVFNIILHKGGSRGGLMNGGPRGQDPPSLLRDPTLHKEGENVTHIYAKCAVF